jgi:hypothetical protein
MRDLVRECSAPGEEAPPAQGYVLDISAGVVVLAGSDGDGAFNAVTTFTQFLTKGSGSCSIGACHLWDFPDFPIRWAFVSSNLRGSNAVGFLRGIADTLAARKCNGIQHGDFKYGILQLQPANYFDSLRAFRRIADERNLEIIPGVAPIGYSSVITYTDPHLAEGIPTTAEYVMEADTGRLLADARVSLPNGGFENISNGQFTGWNFYDGPNVSVFADSAVAHGGRISARCENFVQGNAAGNARFNRLVSCAPFRYYVLSAWIRTQNFSADNVQLLAMGQDSGGAYRTLTFTAYSIPRNSNGWMRVEASFNTLQYRKVLLYAGVWGGSAGTIWWDDISVQDGGLANILRRPGTPLTVRNTRNGATCAEGADFVPIRDAVMEASRGNYGPFHGAPSFRRLGSGSIRNGDTVTITSYHPLTTVAGTDGNGSVMVCVSEDTLYRILGEQISRINAAYAPSRFFMEHDEIRNMNWDDACTKRALSPAALLADNVRRTVGIIDTAHPGAETFVWSDMFDSTHNAHNNYYLINGDLTGVWKDVPRSLIIANWNGGKAAQSLAFFSRLGFRQITSPYYDVGNSSSIRSWRRAMTGVGGVLGSMYTTWENDYDFLTAFGDYMWNGGPAIEHTPLDSASASADPVLFHARFGTDRYAADDIASTQVSFLDASGAVLASVPLVRQGQNFEVALAAMQLTGERYRITATSSSGMTTSTPSYPLRRVATALDATPNAGTFRIGPNYPNPATGITTVAITLPFGHGVDGSSAPVHGVLCLYDALGRPVTTLLDEASSAGSLTVRFDAGLYSPGLYFLHLRSAAGVRVRSIQLLR